MCLTVFYLNSKFNNTRNGMTQMTKDKLIYILSFTAGTSFPLLSLILLWGFSSLILGQLSSHVIEDCGVIAFFDLPL